MGDGSPPWELVDSPLLLDPAVRPPADELAAPAVTTPGKPKKIARRHRAPRRSRWSLIDRIPWPLVVVLAVQAVLSLRLVWSNTAFVDEATYLWAGHLEWEHLLQGTPVPAFATYFSGAPVIYPPLGAIADSLGGLAGARLLSLAFMLGATVMLWGTTSRLYGRRGEGGGTVPFSLLVRPPRCCSRCSGRRSTSGRWPPTTRWRCS
jgi:hypothetical protein